MTWLKKAARNGRKFLNPVPTQVGGPSMFFRVLPRLLTNRRRRSPAHPPGPFVTEPRVFAQPPAGGLRVTWFGHSTSLVEIDGFRILIDPVWEQRASPLQWTGPVRFFPPTLALEDLPALDVVLISHDHYDHLGADTVRRLAGLPKMANARWVTSIGVGKLLQLWGVAQSRLTELDWTDTFTTGEGGRELHVTSLPARHFSGRSLRNRFETLWASFAIEGPEHAVYYGADSGYWPGFEEIGERYRHFDLTMLEIGAFDELWKDIHMGPDGAALAFRTMNSGGLLMPVHWGLFDLALHAWAQPIERMRAIANEQGLPLWSPEPGLPTEVVQGTEVRSDWWMQSPEPGV